MRRGFTGFFTVTGGLLLLGTVAAHAGFSQNALLPNGILPNGILSNGILSNGSTMNGMGPNGVMPNGLIGPGVTLDKASDGLPWHTLSRQALGQRTQ